MSQPLGFTVGNALELREALDTLRSKGPADFREHCLAISSQLLLLAGQTQDTGAARSELAALLDGGQALAKFREWISAQGGDTEYVDNPERLPAARYVREISAPRSGFVAALNAREVGLTSMLLGGGRAKKGDRIDHAVGIVLNAKIGDKVTEGQPLLTIHADDEAKVAGAKQRLLAAYDWSDEPVDAPPLHHTVVS
jgi:pyrimidine-nucleoside phosphorylase